MILGNHVNRRVGHTLAAALPTALLTAHPPLTAAAGWVRVIGRPEPGLLLIDASLQLIPVAPEPESRRRDPEPDEVLPGRVRTWQPAPSAAGQTPPATAPLAGPLPGYAEGDTAWDGAAAGNDAPARGAPAALDPPVTEPRLGTLTTLNSSHGYLPPVAAPLSVAESRTEQRRRFDPQEFAEHVRVALIDDARRHGIGV
jgi:hypothetical protein